MKDPLVEKLVEVAGKMQWPVAHRTGVQNRRYYERGLDEVNAYFGDPQTFLTAFEIFRASDSCSYAYAGVAYTLARASWGNNDLIYYPGLSEAARWLEKAQEWDDDRLEINMVEAYIYIIGKQLDNGRAVLNYLSGQDASSFYYCVLEMLYWEFSKNWDRYQVWFERTMQAATNPMQQAYGLTLLANFYARAGHYERAIHLFKQVVKVKPDDAWAWHKMSVMLLRLNNYKDAELCNRQALSIIDFDAARASRKS